MSFTITHTSRNGYIHRITALEHRALQKKKYICKENELSEAMMCLLLVVLWRDVKQSTISIIIIITSEAHGYQKCFMNHSTIFFLQLVLLQNGKLPWLVCVYRTDRIPNDPSFQTSNIIVCACSLFISMRKIWLVVVITFIRQYCWVFFTALLFLSKLDSMRVLVWRYGMWYIKQQQWAP